jgi:hypothetical protein
LNRLIAIAPDKSSAIAAPVVRRAERSVETIVAVKNADAEWGEVWALVGTSA